jgi:hypothetical protein
VAFIVKNKPIDYKALDTGTYPARLVGIAGVGEQEKSWDGKNQLRDLVVFVFETIGFHRSRKDGTPYTMTVNGQEVPEPQTVRTECSRSLAANSNMLKVVSKLMAVPEDPTELDIEQALGAPCLLSVEKKVAATGTEYNKIDTVSPPLMGMAIEPARTSLFCYDVESHTDEAFDALPEWIQEMVKKSTQWLDMHTPTTPVQTAPPHLAVVGNQTINTQTGEIISPTAPNVVQPPAPVFQPPVMTSTTAQKAPF